MTAPDIDSAIEEILMFGFESQDFVNDLIGKERLDEGAAQIKQLLLNQKLEDASAYKKYYSKKIRSEHQRYINTLPQAIQAAIHRHESNTARLTQELKKEDND